MSRRFTVPTVVTIVAAFFGVLGIYLGSLHAGDAGISAPEEIRHLRTRIVSLESRLEALEKKQGVFFLSTPSTPTPQAWPNDGFGPVRTIPADIRTPAVAPKVTRTVPQNYLQVQPSQGK